MAVIPELVLLIHSPSLFTAWKPLLLTKFYEKTEPHEVCDLSQPTFTFILFLCFKRPGLGEGLRTRQIFEGFFSRIFLWEVNLSKGIFLGEFEHTYIKFQQEKTIIS